MGLIEAAKAGDVTELAKALAQGGVDLEAWDERGRTALYCAAMSGGLGCVKMLADAGARLRNRDYLGVFPGQAAAMNGHREVLLEFLKRDPLFHCDEIMAPVLIGSSLLNGRLECADVVLGACRECMGEQRSFADEAAMYVCRTAEMAAADVAAMYVSRTAEMEAAGAWGAALGWLKKNGLKKDMAGSLGERVDGRMILALAKQGCAEGMREMIRLDAQDGGGLARSIRQGHGDARSVATVWWPSFHDYSLLCVAAESRKPGARSACEAALEVLDSDSLGGEGCGSEANPGMEAARCAALAGNEEIALWLDAMNPVLLGGVDKSKRARALRLEDRFVRVMADRQPEILARLLAGAKLPIQEEADAARLAWWAISKGSDALLEQALALRPKRAFWKPGRDRRDDVLLAWAAKEGKSLGAIEALLARGADPKARDEEGAPALVLAARAGKEEVVKSLVDAGADLEARCPDGESALMAASAMGSHACSVALLDAGAKVDARDRQGGTPAMRAARAGHLECFEELLARGANLGEKDGDGVACVDMALASRNQRLAALAQAWAIGVETQKGKAGQRRPARL